MKLATILESNDLSMSKIMNFRAANSLDVSKPHNENFHQHKNQYSYFGFIQIEIDNCTPFVMFSCNDDLVAMTYYWYGADSYERKSVSEWVSRSIDSQVILDVGSFTGLYSLAAIASKKSLENVKVYAFEPTKRVHSRLLMNIQTNKLRNVIEPVNLAVSNCVEQVRFLQYRGDYILGTGASFIDKGIESTSDEEIVDTISIDEFIEQKKIKPQLIKIDVEQAEVLALEGMRQTLSDCSPTILIEVAPKTIEQSVSILTDHGYQLSVINEENQALVNINDAPHNKVQNILAEK
jgi:FkbM family methyltransferase